MELDLNISEYGSGAMAQVSASVEPAVWRGFRRSVLVCVLVGTIRHTLAVMLAIPCALYNVPAEMILKSRLMGEYLPEHLSLKIRHAAFAPRNNAMYIYPPCSAGH